MTSTSEQRRSTRRPWDELAEAETVAPVADLASSGDRDAAMQAFVDLLWPHLHPTGVSWLGFYLDRPDAEDDQRLVLGAHRDRPACSPIGVHGVCGQALLAKAPRVVRDVAALGPNYIACDPRDRSEVVVPLIDGDGACRAVLDLDSHDAGAFDESDATGLTMLLRAAGLTR